MPSDLIQKRLNELSQLSGKLRRETDAINSLLESFQNQLNSLDLEVPAFINDKVVTGDGTQVRFGYDRSPDWCLVYQTRLPAGRPAHEASNSSNWDKPQKLVEAPRDLRIQALPLLPKLLGAVKTSTEKTLGELRFAKTNFIEEIKKL